VRSQLDGGQPDQQLPMGGQATKGRHIVFTRWNIGHSGSPANEQALANGPALSSCVRSE
jgi:hypothetical protein